MRRDPIYSPGSADVRMIQRGEDLRFSLEAPEPIGIERECLG